jgi:hypothetical protein
MRLPPAIKMFDDSRSEAWNHVHGRRPQNRNSAKLEILGDFAAGITYANTNV